MHPVLLILLATILSSVIGALWFSPLLLGKRWMELLNLTDQDTQNGANKAMSLAFLASFLKSSFIYLLFVGFRVDTLPVAMAFVGMVWVASIVQYGILDVGFEEDSVQLFLIKSMHQLVTMLSVGVLFILLM